MYYVIGIFRKIGQNDHGGYLHDCPDDFFISFIYMDLIYYIEAQKDYSNCRKRQGIPVYNIKDIFIDYKGNVC